MNKWWIFGIIAIVVIAIIIVAVKYGKKSGELAAVKGQPGVFNPYELTNLTKQYKKNADEVKMSDIKLK